MIQNLSARQQEHDVHVVRGTEITVESVHRCGTLGTDMVVVAQLVEPQFVVLVVAGSSPVDHPGYVM